MSITGIISEYNPFHNGHKYLIQKHKENFPDSYFIAVMSGNFTQRGEIALVDKWQRAKLAVANGIDLVIELPFVFAVRSAQYFAKGGIDLLHKFMGFRKITPYTKGLNPVAYLDNLKVLTKKIIVANANYADETELQQLSQTGVKYVYQPKYSEEICNKKLEFSTVLDYFKENFGFSTQSFSENKSFSLLELANEANREVNLPIDELIKYLTIYPAKILRLENTTGSIKIGKDADFNVFKLPEGEDFTALKNISIPYATYSRGRKLIKAGNVRFSL